MEGLMEWMQRTMVKGGSDAQGWSSPGAREISINSGSDPNWKCARTFLSLDHDVYMCVNTTWWGGRDGRYSGGRVFDDYYRYYFDDYYRYPVSLFCYNNLFF